MFATIDYIYHQSRKVGSTICKKCIMQVFPALFTLDSCCSLCHSHTDGEDRVCTELCLIFSPVERDHFLIDLALIQHRHALECGSDDFIYMLDSGEDALAKVALHVSIAQLNSLMCTCGCSRGYRRSELPTILESQKDTNSWLASRVKDFERVEGGDMHISRLN